MKLNILTPTKKLLMNVEVEELFAIGPKGELNLLNSHSQFVSKLETGMVKWKDSSGSWDSAAISVGYLEVDKDTISILAETGELKAQIDIERAKNAEQRSRKLLDVGGLNDDDLRKNELKLQRALARQMATRV